MTFALDAVHETPGLNEEMMGFANRQQAGVLEAHRKQSGLTIIAGLFDAIRRYRKEQGRTLLHFIQTYISDNRLIRIVGDAGQEQYVPLAKQPGTAEYDVIVDEAPTSPNMKERVYGALVEIMPSLSKLGVPMPPELLDYAPIPSTLAQKWKEMIENAVGDPEETQRVIEDLNKQIEKLTTENRSLADKREEMAFELKLKEAEAEAELDIKRQEMERDHEIEVRKVEGNLELKRREIAAKHNLEARDLEMEPEAGPLTQVLAQLVVVLSQMQQPKKFDFERGEDGLIKSAEEVPTNVTVQ